MTTIKTYDITTAEGARFSPHAWRTTMALAHKGLDHECEKIGFTDIPAISRRTAFTSVFVKRRSSCRISVNQPRARSDANEIAGSCRVTRTKCRGRGGYRIRVSFQKLSFLFI